MWTGTGRLHLDNIHYVREFSFSTSLAFMELLTVSKSGNPIGYPCPHFAAIKGAVEKKLGADTKIIDWTH